MKIQDMSDPDISQRFDDFFCPHDIPICDDVSKDVIDMVESGIPNTFLLGLTYDEPMWFIMQTVHYFRNG